MPRGGGRAQKPPEFHGVQKSQMLCLHQKIAIANAAKPRHLVHSIVQEWALSEGRRRLVGSVEETSDNQRHSANLGEAVNAIALGIRNLHGKKNALEFSPSTSWLPTKSPLAFCQKRKFLCLISPERVTHINCSAGFEGKKGGPNRPSLAIRGLVFVFSLGLPPVEV